MRFNELQKLFEYYKGEIEKLGYSFIDFSTTPLSLMESTNKYGYCSYRYQNRDKNKKYNCMIKINRFLLVNGTDREITQTLIHELIHAVNYTNNNGHNAVWKKLADIIGSNFGYTITRCSNYSKNTLKPSEKYKYIVYCADCNREWKYKRNTTVIKKVAQCKCPYCHTNTLKLNVL